LVVAAFAVSSALFVSGAAISEGFLRLALAATGAIYCGALLGAVILATRASASEGTCEIAERQHILLVAPHQDDCVLMAGGLCLRNQRLGGDTNIVYLVQPDDEETARVRRREAVNAWTVAGVPATNLRHWSCLPARGPLDRGHIEQLSQALQNLIDELNPSLICIPSFEGGHLHHDVANYVVTRELRLPVETRINESPEYSPYFSVWRTPQKALAHLTRLAFLGLVSYYPKPEGAGRGRILNLRMSTEELHLKWRMLKEFRSQHGDALARSHGYADRLIDSRAIPYCATPFRFEGSLASLASRMTGMVPRWLLARLFPGDQQTIGLESGITNLDRLLK
jgi:hypothetical protein